MPTDQSAGYNQDFDIEKKAQELLEETDSDSRIRIFDSKFAKLLAVGLIIWSLFQLYYNTIGVMSTILSSLAYFIFALLYLCLLSGVQKGKTETKASSPFLTWL